MRRPGVIATVLALVVVVSLLGASDVRGGGGALVVPKRTSGPALTATITMDVTGGSSFPGKGLTSIRVQKASASAGALFVSSYVAGFVGSCTGLDFPATAVAASTNARFVGMMDGFVDTPSVLSALISQFGNPSKAAITDTDSATCTSVPGGAGGLGPRTVLSFTAVIQFTP